MQQKWIEQIDQLTALFQEQFGSLINQELNWKPSPNTWSIAQNIEHLILINKTYINVFSELKSGKIKLPFYCKINFISAFFGKLILDGVEPERKKKAKTFPIWFPSESEVEADILEQFSKNQSALKLYIRELESFFKENTIIHSPVSKRIILPLSMTFEILITHENRHFNQAKEVLGLLQKEKNSLL